MPSLQLDNLFVMTMDFMDHKENESQSLCKSSMSTPPKIQLMKKVIVRMVNNALQLNFHPKLSALAKSKPLNVQVFLSLKRQN